MYRKKRVSESSLNDLVQVWNEGWKGYFIDMTMDMNKILRRFPVENLSAELSFIAYDGDKPVGFVLNGTREIKGKLIAWNGGTAVTPEYRKKGIGRELIQKAVETYKEQNVAIARLEAIFENDKAIELYKSEGYETFEYLVHSQYNQISSEPTLAERLHQILSKEQDNLDIEAQAIAPGKLEELHIYRENAPWQAQWFNVNQSEAMILTNSDKEAIGYILYNQVKSSLGELMGLNIYQFEIEQAGNERALLSYGLSKLIEAFPSVTKLTAAYISENNQHFNVLLYELGFKKIARQVHMEKHLLHN